MKRITNAKAQSALRFDSGVDDLLDHPALMDSCQPGVCMECGEVSEPHEPDARANWCPLCEANAVQSLSVVLGFH